VQDHGVGGAQRVRIALTSPASIDNVGGMEDEQQYFTLSSLIKALESLELKGSTPVVLHDNKGGFGVVTGVYLHDEQVVIS
jgi:hypothetical protein